MADTTILTRPTNGVSYGYTHTITSDDATNKGIVFDFQASHELAAIIEYLSSVGVVTALTGAAITNPADGKIRIGDYGFEIAKTTLIELAAKYTAHIADAAEHTVVDTDNGLAGTISATSTLAELLAFVSDFMLKYNTHDDDVDGIVSDLATAIRRANTLKTIIVAHIADVAEHAGLDPAGALLNAIPTATSLATLITLTNALTTYYTDHDDNTDGVVSTLANAIVLANNLKTAIADHIADVAEHANLDPAGALISAVPNATDLATLITLTNALTTYYTDHDDDVDGVVSTLANALTRANSLKAAIVSHMADAAEHTVVDPIGTTLNAVPDATDLATLITLTNAMTTYYTEHDDDVDGIVSTLNKAIVRANSLKTALVTHIADAVEHGSVDPVGALLNVVPNASDLATLITLTNALTNYYTDHDDDVNGVCSTLNNAMARANSLKTALVNHMADATEHAIADFTRTALNATPDATDLATLVTLTNALTTAYINHDDDVDGVCSDLNAAINRANTLQTITVAHMADATEHPGGADPAGATLAAIPAATDLATLITLVTGLITAYVAHDDDVDEVAPTYHQATSVKNNLASAAAPINLAESCTRLEDIETKYNLHEADATSHDVGSAHTAPLLAVHVTVSAENALAAEGAVATLGDACTRLEDIETKFNLHDADATSHTVGGTYEVDVLLYHIAVSAENALASTAAVSDLPGSCTRLEDIETKFNLHDADATAHTVGGVYEVDVLLYHVAVSAENALASMAVVSDLAGSCTRLEDIETKFNLHDADATSHTVGGVYEVDVLAYHQAVSAQNALAATTVVSDLAGSCTRLEDIETKFNLHDADATSHTTGGVYAVAVLLYHVAVSAQNALASVATVSDLAGASTRLEDIETKYNLHDTDATSHTTGGTHQATVVLYHVAISAENQIVDTTAPTTVTEAIVDINNLRTALLAHDVDATSHTAGGTHQVVSPAITATEFVFTAGSKLKVVAQRAKTA